jgi:GNAT superfamily N-acetyltransferase
MWEAADPQWWWRRPRATDELALPVWFDEAGPVAAGLTAWEDTWQPDVFAVPSMVNEEEVWAATLEAAAAHRVEALRVLVDDTTRVGLLQPMRVEEEYQRRGLARMLPTNGLDRLAGQGARRLKVGFEADAARQLYLDAGFVPTSVDRLLIRPAAHGQSGR